MRLNFVFHPSAVLFDKFPKSLFGGDERHDSQDALELKPLDSQAKAYEKAYEYSVAGKSV